jgi:hypothetical protein
VKDIFLVGESLPLKEDGSKYRVTQCGLLGPSLEGLDPRHGVFCNFVTTPLLSTISALSTRKADVAPLLNQLEHLLADKSDRRFNLFEEKKKGRSEPFVIRDDLVGRVAGFDPTKHLWLLTGFQTSFGLLAWLLDDQQTSVWQRTQIEEVAFAFLTAASTYESPIAGWPLPVEIKPKTGHSALLHRLCVEHGGQLMLARAVQTMAKPNVNKDNVVELMRSCVPLLHNEGYRQDEIGNVQSWFVRFATGNIQEKAQHQYWQVMGNAIAFRLREEFITR